jgi:hypothetical protein
VKDNNNHTWFLNASKEKARESEEKILVHNIVVSISARKHRDLHDIIAEVEQSHGWPNVIEYLIKANDKAYSYRMGSKGPEVQLEPLKYREVIFKLFHCEGLEPVEADTITLLQELNHEASIADAIHRFSQRVERFAWKQIDKNDLIFFTPPYDNIWISDDLKNNILKFQKKEINNTTLWKTEIGVNIKLLWYSELGRKALSSICSQGFYISEDELSEVLTVIQVSPKPQIRIIDYNENEAGQYEIIPPSHQDYKNLLTSIIEKNADTLSHLGSRHCIPTLNCMLYDALKNYEINPSSHNYQNALAMIFNHVKIRALDSIAILEQLSQLEDKRIATIAIIALGNFFDKSAALALIDLLCNKKNNEVIENALTALEHHCMNSPESVVIIENALKNDCINYGKLKRLYSKISKIKMY